MRTSIFRFKKFDCSHGSGSMKIGVDAVLIGSWATVERARTILDVGTGCGVIALMCAQRNESAFVDAIDVDHASIAEAAANFANSPWSARLRTSYCDFNKLADVRYDLIISNPPYFDSGVSNPDTPRMLARHQSGLSPAKIIEKGSGLLSPEGRIAMVVPAEQYEELRVVACHSGLKIVRAAWVRGHPDAPVKRVLVEMSAADEDIVASDIPILTLETSPGCPTDEHRELCRDFYLKF